MGQYFKVKLYNAAYHFQRESRRTGLKNVYAYRPCCIAENGFVLGVNDACEQFDITVGEPLDKAQSKCADLYVETPRFVILRKASASFVEICSRFGIAKTVQFDECLLETNNLDCADIHPFTQALLEAIEDELGVQADIRLCDEFEQCLNSYSASTDWDDRALKYLAEMLSFKLSIDNACAKMFSLTITDTSGAVHTADRRVEMCCSDYEMLYLVLKNMLDPLIKPAHISVKLYDIVVKQSDDTAESKQLQQPKKKHKKRVWDYTKQNKRLSDILNKNELYVFEKFCDYIENNPDSLGFDELCALAEKANTRRLKRGGYYINSACAEMFVNRCKLFDSGEKSVLVNGYLPFSLLFEIREFCDADFYYSNLDERTLKVFEILDSRFQGGEIKLKPATEREYDIALSNAADVPFCAKNKILIVKKSFFASDERHSVENSAIVRIFDFGDYGVSGVDEQFAAIIIDEDATPDATQIVSLENDFTVTQKQRYITDESLPCWVIYRNEKFDSVCRKMQFDLFDVQCSGQIKQRDYNAKGDVCVISALCIDNDGKVNIDEGCRHATSNDVKKYEISRYVERDDVLFAAAKSTVFKVARKPKGCIPSPSTVLLIPKGDVKITDEDLNYYMSPEFKYFYDVALNHQNFCLTNDRVSQYFIGKRVS